MNVTFLTAADGTPLTKAYQLVTGGKLESSCYPMVKNLTSYNEEVHSIEQLHKSLLQHANHGHCLLKGSLDRQLLKASRAGHTNPTEPTELLVIDNDHAHDIAPQQLTDLLGLGDVDYVIQHSASSGIKPGHRGYHLYFLLASPMTPQAIKQVMREWNLSIPQLSNQIGLAKSYNALLWPLDITVNQNDKLIYIAPPICGEGISDPYLGNRFALVKGQKRHATFECEIMDEQTLKSPELHKLNELRAKAGLDPKQLTGERVVGGVLVAKNPDPVRVTGVKHERGFSYLNLNGGDSWGYYHPEDNPDIIHNFKGEPPYLTRELAPDYFAEAKAHAKEVKPRMAEQRIQDYRAHLDEMVANAEQGNAPLRTAFRDAETDCFFIGTIEPQTKKHNLRKIGDRMRIKDFMVQHGLPSPQFIETWNYRFEPANDVFFDRKNRFLNQYIPSPYYRAAKYLKRPSIPPSIRHVITSALGGDPGLVEHFINWLAVIFRYRIRTETAWVLQGTTGTGKGLLFHQIIRPLIGMDYCRLITLANLEDGFNQFMAQCLVLFVDEVDTDQVKQMQKLIAKLKSLTTEERLPIRAMRTDLREVPNHLNIIMASNQPNSMRIETNDRRFNVCPRQENKILQPGESGEELIAAIQAELQDFANYLISCPADKAKARQAIDNESKRLLQSITQTAAEEVAEAIKTGDLQYFIDHGANSALCSSELQVSSPIATTTSYGRIIEAANGRAAQGRPHLLRHPDLFVLFEQLVGDIPESKARLSKRLNHLGIHIKPVTVEGENARGIKVHWQLPKASGK